MTSDVDALAIARTHRIDAGTPADEGEAADLRVIERIAALDLVEPAPGWIDRAVARWRNTTRK